MEMQTHGRLISEEITGIVLCLPFHSGFVCLRARFERRMEECKSVNGVGV